MVELEKHELQQQSPTQRAATQFAHFRSQSLPRQRCEWQAARGTLRITTPGLFVPLSRSGTHRSASAAQLCRSIKPSSCQNSKHAATLHSVFCPNRLRPLMGGSKAQAVAVTSAITNDLAASSCWLAITAAPMTHACHHGCLPWLPLHAVFSCRRQRQQPCRQRFECCRSCWTARARAE